MLPLKTSAANMLAKVKEKLMHGIRVLSPAEALLWKWARQRQTQADRAYRYRVRNASYPYQSKRQIARNLAKMKKADVRAEAQAAHDMLVYGTGVIGQDSRGWARCIPPWRRLQMEPF